jgi:hypothetical protein
MCNEDADTTQTQLISEGKLGAAAGKRNKAGLT